MALVYVLNKDYTQIFLDLSPKRTVKKVTRHF